MVALNKDGTSFNWNKVNKHLSPASEHCSVPSPRDPLSDEPSCDPSYIKVCAHPHHIAMQRDKI